MYLFFRLDMYAPAATWACASAESAVRATLSKTAGRLFEFGFRRKHQIHPLLERKTQKQAAA